MDPFPRFPNGAPTERHPSTEPSTSHPLKIHLSPRAPGKGAPSMFPNRVCMERDTPSVCHSPPTKWGKTWSPSTEPHTDRRPT